MSGSEEPGACAADSAGARWSGWAGDEVFRVPVGLGELSAGPSAARGRFAPRGSLWVPAVGRCSSSPPTAAA
ncbi:hypothetical protein SAZ11_13430 [Streptomyces sp. FXJ1.4098]|nr:hypothetical protein [Streptomyces sp. FXJ1.4098]